MMIIPVFIKKVNCFFVAFTFSLLETDSENGKTPLIQGNVKKAVISLKYFPSLNELKTLG